MIDSKVYLVREEIGEYDDKQVLIVAAFDNLRQANNFKNREIRIWKDYKKSYKKASDMYCSIVSLEVNPEYDEEKQDDDQDFDEDTEEEIKK